MTDKIKTSFEFIRAEDKLKSDTTQYLQKEIAARKAHGQKIQKLKSASLPAVKRYGVIFRAVIILFISAVFTYSLYTAPAAYVDVDINPSIELVLNGFDRVIGYYAYNNDGEDIINNLSLMHKSYEDALITLMESMAEQGYFKGDTLVSVTLQTNDNGKEKVLLSNIQAGMTEYITDHHHTAQIDVFPVTGATRSHSQEQGVSPAKYIAIQELIEVDPTASVENCRNHSISEIRQLAQEHGNNHNHCERDSHSDCNTIEDILSTEQENRHHGRCR